MNRELISRFYNEAVDHCVKLGPNPDGTNRAWVWEEKFTELIIKECIKEIVECEKRRSIVHPSWHHSGGIHVTETIKEYFGVE